MDMIHKEFLDTILINGFDCFSYLDTSMKVLVEKVHRHPALVQEYAVNMSRTTKIKIEDGAEKKKDELIGQLPSETES